MSKQYSSRQAFVDSVVHACLQRGVRTRREIAAEVHRGMPERWLLDAWQQSVKVAISRTTSRTVKGIRDIWCVPGEYRYVSVKRVQELTRRWDKGSMRSVEYAERLASLADLHTVAEHQYDKAMELFGHRKRIMAVLEGSAMKELENVH